MGSVAFGLGQIGAGLEGAKELQRKEQLDKIKLALQQQQGQRAQDEFDWRKKQESAPQVVHSYRGTDGKVHNVVRDPTTGKLSDVLAGDAQEATAQTDKLAAFKQLFGRDPNDEEKKMMLGLDKQFAPHWSSKETVRDPKSPTGWSWVETNDTTGESRNTPGAPDPYRKRSAGEGGGSGLPEKTIKALADKWANEGIKPPAKYQADVESYMEDNKLKGKTKLNASEQNISDIVKQMEPQITKLEKLITDNNLANEGGVFSAIGQQGRMAEYRMGIKPDQLHADLIKGAAALQVMGAGPWMRLGRGKYMFETIKQHLPSPTDTPELLLDKLQFLQGIIDDAKSSLPNAGDTPAGDTNMLPGERSVR